MKLIYSILFCLTFSIVTFPQKQWLRGELISIDENGIISKQKRTEVYIKETGDRDVTDENGLFRIFIKQELRSGDKVTIGIVKDGWEIKSPLLGEIYLPHEPNKTLITINILPKQSPAFYLNPQEYAEYYALKSQSNTGFYLSKQFKPDFIALLDTLENIWGFKKSEIKIAVNDWIEKTLKYTTDSYEKGLAQYTKENYTQAAGFFIRSVEMPIENFRVVDSEFKIQSEKRIALSKEIARGLKLAGESYFKIKQYDSSITAYKTAIEFLNYNEAWEDLVSTLNKIAICYYYVSLKSHDESILQNLDSANAYSNRGLDLAIRKSLDEWVWKFRGNLATLTAAREIYSDRVDKTSELFTAISNLELVEDRKQNDNDLRDKFLSRNNIGICYDYLYQFTENIIDAKQYLDSAGSSYISMINDSSLRMDYPLEWSYVIYNYALTSIDIGFNKHSILTYFQMLALRIRNSVDCSLEDSLYQKIDPAYIKSLHEIYLRFLEAEKIINEQNKSFELASILNSIAKIRIQLMIYSNDYLNHNFIQVTDSIILCANELASKDNFFREIMFAKVNKASLDILKVFYNKTTSTDEIIQSNTIIENFLASGKILKLYGAYLKRIMMLNYFLLSNMINDQSHKSIYNSKTLLLNKEIIEDYKELSYFREYEEAVRIQKIFNYTN